MIIKEFQLLQSYNSPLAPQELRTSFQNRETLPLNAASIRSIFNRGSSGKFTDKEYIYYTYNGVIYDKYFKVVGFKGAVNNSILRTKKLVGNVLEYRTWFLNKGDFTSSTLNSFLKYSDDINILSSSAFIEFYQKEISINVIPEADKKQILKNHLAISFSTVDINTILRQLNGEPIEEEIEEEDTPQVTEVPEVTDTQRDAFRTAMGTVIADIANDLGITPIVFETQVPDEYRVGMDVAENTATQIEIEGERRNEEVIEMPF